MSRIYQEMEQERPYLDPLMKMEDFAKQLGVNRSALSDCVNSCEGCSFPQFINRYRVDYAKQLLRSRPDMKISSVCTESGFATEASFFRNFKAIAGMTPGEWVQQREKI